METKIDDVMMDCEIGRLKPHPSNARKGDVEAIKRSLERFGQVKPLIVQRSTGFIVAGNHTFEAAKRLKWKTVRILVKDMNDDEAAGYLLADNATSDKAGYDDAELYKLLSTTLDLEGTGYSIDDIETLADALGSATVDEEKGEAVRTQATPRDSTRGRIASDGTTRMRDIVLLMTQEDAQVFGQQIAQLQSLFGTRTVVETVRRAVAEALAQSGQAAPKQAAPIFGAEG